jgi:hypothetical protein
MAKKTRKYQDYLIESLKDPKEAVGYLRAATEDEDPSVFSLALKNVALAHNILVEEPIENFDPLFHPDQTIDIIKSILPYMQFYDLGRECWLKAMNIKNDSNAHPEEGETGYLLYTLSLGETIYD